MSLSSGDLATRGLVKYNLTATTGNDITSGAAFRIMKISITPATTAVATFVVANAATVTGTDLIHLQAAVNGTSVVLDLAPNGIKFGTGMSYTLTGTGNLGEIYGLAE